jgi:uncharacterized protein (DUF58 family)
VTGTRWRPTHAFVRAVLFVMLMLLLAVWAGRPDMAVLGAPVALATAIALSRRPSTVPEIAVATGTGVHGEGGRVPVRISVTNPGDVPYDLVVVRLAASRWLRLEEGALPLLTGVPAAGVVDVDIECVAARWGRQRLGPVHAHVVAADGLLVSPLIAAPDRDVPVYPIPAVFTAADTMPRASGIIGAHRTRRVGDGGEMAGVRAFAPGDRLRRIDWRISLRTRQLHVVSTLSDRDTPVFVLIDVIHEAGTPDAFDAPPTALDNAVRAAAAIANHYLNRGDRVGLLEHGHAARYLRPAAGRRHYLAALEWLLDVRPIRGATVPENVNDHRIPPQALLIVLTPMVDVRSTAMLARLASTGRSVIAIDTMPPAIIESIGVTTRKPPAATPWLRNAPLMPSAARLWRYDRANTIAQLRDHGVPVVAWAGPGSLDDVLRQMSRVVAR